MSYYISVAQNDCENCSGEDCLEIKNCRLKVNGNERTLLSCDEKSESVDLRGQNISHICPKAFLRSTSKMKVIDLSFNYLSVLNDNLFDNFTILNELNLSSNKFQTFSPILLQFNNKLEVLDLSENLITNLDSDFLSFSFILEKLDLSRNRLDGLPSLRQQIFLRCLNLSSNMLKGNKLNPYKKKL